MNEKEFNYYSGFCHFIKHKEFQERGLCTNFDGGVFCNQKTCPIIKSAPKEEAKNV